MRGPRRGSLACWRHPVPLLLLHLAAPVSCTFAEQSAYGESCMLNSGRCHGNLYRLIFQTGSYGGIDTGDDHTYIDVADWDSDGDQDLIIGLSTGEIQVRLQDNLGSHSYTTVSTLKSPQELGFSSGTTDTDPSLTGVLPTPHACDWNGDGLMDLVVGGVTGELKYFQRAAGGLLLEPDASEDPFRDIYVSGGSSPYTVDYDQDGDLDLFVGTKDGLLVYFENVGGSLEHRSDDYDEQVGASQSPLKNVDVRSWAKPTAVDFDGDNDTDVIVTSFDANVAYWEGTASGTLLSRHGASSPFSGFAVGSYLCVRYVEFSSTESGVLVSNYFSGELLWFKRERLQSGTGSLSPREGFANPFRRLDSDQQLVLSFDVSGEAETYSRMSGDSTRPAVVDWDGDGFEDLVVGHHFTSASSRISMWRRTSTWDLVPLIGAEEDPFYELLVDAGGCTQRNQFVSVQAVRWDGDDLLDLVVAVTHLQAEDCSSVTAYSEVLYFAGTANAGSPFGLQLVQKEGAENPFAVIGDTHASEVDDGYSRAAIFVVDWDDDGMLDVLVGYKNGAIEHYAPTGPGSALELQTGGVFQYFPWVASAGNLVPAAGSWDDTGGLPDLVAGDGTGNVHLFRRADLDGAASASDLDNIKETLTVLDESHASPALSDWDADGDVDLLAGHRAHGLNYFSRSWCEPEEPCNFNGVCQSVKGTCTCLQGYDNVDCSECDTFFHRFPLPEDSLHCEACPSTFEKVGATCVGFCCGRGACLDDVSVKANPNFTATQSLMAIGSGNCECAEPFHGVDTALSVERATCSQGACPEGLELVSLDDGSHLYCQSCYPGYYKEEVSNDECKPCVLGRFARNSGASQCEQCPPGQYQENPGETACANCEEGSSSDLGASACRTCTAGKYAPTAGYPECTTCEPGRVNNEDRATSCEDCPEGMFSGSSPTECKECEIAKFSPNPGMETCQDCDANKYASIGESECHICAGGRRLAEERHDCKYCAKGKWSTGQTDKFACDNCEPGYRPTFPDEEFSGQNRREACVLCEAGRVNPTGDLPEQDECLDCDPGKYSSDDRTQCLLCAPGYYNNAIGSSSCTGCDAGQYVAENGTTTCVDCPVGLISGDAAFLCTGCPAGQEADELHASCVECNPGQYSKTSTWETNANAWEITDRGVCTDCLAGRFSRAEAGECDNCPSGKYQPLVGQESCQDCDPGLKPVIDEDTGRRYECEACESGKRSVAGQEECEPCLGGTQPSLDTCVECPAGKYSYDQNDTACEDPDPPVCGVCQDCAPGYFSAAGESECSACPPGRKSSQGEWECHVCEKGFFAPAAASDCEECDPGFVSEEESESCEPCLAGTIAVDAECRNCSAGNYSDYAQDRCSQCDAGKYSDDGASVCLTCDEGKYNQRAGASACQTCTGGSPSADAVLCIPCIAGRFSNEGTCEDCPIGQYQPDEGSTACEVCDSGSGTWQAGQLECEECEKGRYSDNGLCLECPANRTTLSPGTTSESQCICIEGTQCGLPENCTKGWPCVLTLLAEDIADDDTIAIAATCGGGDALVQPLTRSGYNTTNFKAAFMEEDAKTYILCKQGAVNIPVGTFTLFGPDDTHQSTCFLGRDCVINDGIAPQEGDMLWVLPTCGIEEGVPPGLYSGGIGVATSEGVFNLSNSSSELLAVFPGTYRMCWCRPHVTLKNCSVLQDFDVQIGLFILAGPYKHKVYTCMFNERCVIDLSSGNELGGVGLSKDDRILVRQNELCTSTEAIGLTGFGDLNGMSHPASSAGRNLSFGQLSDSLWLDFPPSSSLTTYRLCYSEYQYLDGKNMSSLPPEAFVAQAGTLSLTCPPGYFTSGTECAECLQGYYCVDGAMLSACPGSKTTNIMGAVNASQCVCPIGYHIGVDEPCVLCEVGTYASQTNQTACEPCPEGYTSNLQGMTSLGQCSSTTDDDRGSVTVYELTGVLQVSSTDDWSGEVQSDIENGIKAVLDGAGYQHVPDDAIHVDEVTQNWERRLQDTSLVTFHVRYTVALDSNSSAQQVQGVLTDEAVEQWVLAQPNTPIVSLLEDEPSVINQAVVKCPSLKVIPETVAIPTVEDCVCDKGYRNTPNDGCEVCPVGTYKDEAGDVDCTRCGYRGDALLVTVDVAAVSSDLCLCPAGRHDPTGERLVCDFCPEDMYCPVGVDPVACPPGTIGDPNTERSTQSFCICDPGLLDNRDPPGSDKSISPCGCRTREYMVFKDTEGRSFECKPCGLNCEQGSCTMPWLDCENHLSYEYWDLTMLHETVGKPPEHECAARADYGPTGYTTACTLEDGTSETLRQWVVPAIPEAFEGYFVMDRPDTKLRPNMTDAELLDLLKQWREYDVRDYLLECTDDSTCPGGSEPCAEGREGVACSECKEGWTGGTEGPCRPCTGLGKYTFFITSLGVIVLIIVLYQVAFSRTTAVGDAVTTGMLKAMRSVKQSMMNSVRYAQAMGGVTKSFSFSVPEVNLSVLNLFTFVTLDVGNLIDLGCMTRMSFETLVIVRMLLPIWLAFMVFGAALVNNGVGSFYHWLRNRFRKLRGLPMAESFKMIKLHDGFGVYLSLFFLFFLSMLEQNLDFFICIEMPSEDYVVASRRNIFCGSHFGTRKERVSRSWTVLAPFVLLYVLLFTTLSVTLLLVVYRRIRRGSKTARLHFRAQIVNFRKGTYWWLLVMIIKDILYAVTGVFLPGDAYAQAIYSTFVMMSYMFVTLMVWPFEPAYLNTQEIVLQVLASIQLLLGGLSGFGERMPANQEQQRVRTLLVVQILGLICIVWYLVLDVGVLVTALNGKASNVHEQWEGRWFNMKRKLFGSLTRTNEKTDIHIICDLVGVIIRQGMMSVGTHIDDESIRRFKKWLHNYMLTLDRHEQSEWLRAATSLIAVTIVRDRTTLRSIGHHFGLLGWRNFDFSEEDLLAEETKTSTGPGKSASSTISRTHRSGSHDSVDTIEEVREIEQHGWSLISRRSKLNPQGHSYVEGRSVPSSATSRGRLSSCAEDGAPVSHGSRGRTGSLSEDYAPSPSSTTSASGLKPAYKTYATLDKLQDPGSPDGQRPVSRTGRSVDGDTPLSEASHNHIVLKECTNPDVTTRQHRDHGRSNDSSDLSTPTSNARGAVSPGPKAIAEEDSHDSRECWGTPRMSMPKVVSQTLGGAPLQEKQNGERHKLVSPEQVLEAPLGHPDQSAISLPADAFPDKGSAMRQRGPTAWSLRPANLPAGDNVVQNGIQHHNSDPTRRKFFC